MAEEEQTHNIGIKLHLKLNQVSLTILKEAERERGRKREKGSKAGSKWGVTGYAYAMWYVEIKNAINLSTSLCLLLLSLFFLLLLLFLQTLQPHVCPPLLTPPSHSLSICLSVCLPARLVAVITYVCRQFMLSSASQSQLAAM